MNIFTYNNFTSEAGHLSFNEAEKIYNKLISSANHLDKEFQEYWHEFIVASLHYSQARGKWWTISQDERREFDSTRTTLHNKVIFQLKLLKGIIKESNGDTSWFDDITEDRKRIGDFACYVIYIYSVNAR